MAYVPSPHEIIVLMAFKNDTKLEWGAWVGACIEFLQEAGFLTWGPDIKITEIGLKYLEDTLP